jgi:hypothetical protein
VRAASQWGKRVADLLTNADDCAGPRIQRQFRALLGAMARPQPRSAPPRASMLAHCRKGTHSDWPGLFHCDEVPALPRTNNELEQCFGAHRYHERRATGRKGASPALVLRGAVKRAACAATRLHPVDAEGLAPAHLHAWRTLREQLDMRQRQRVRRHRFRRHPDAYLAALENQLLQRILPP